jgi:hypothetical protein
VVPLVKPPAYLLHAANGNSFAGTEYAATLEGTSFKVGEVVDW